jgi:hypothetical protein
MAIKRGQVGLLTRHFFRRFFDNDLLAPGEDMRALASAILAGLGVFCAAVALMFFLKYNPPERLALAERLAMALNDKTLFLAGAMTVMALVTLIAWDALFLDARDFAILGPLPVEPRVALLAKLIALAGLATSFAVAVNLLPALLFPTVMLATMPVGLGYVCRMMAAHAVAGVAACAFTFLGLAALRGALLVALPGGTVRRLLPGLQFVLVLGCLALLLLIPLAVMLTRPAIEAVSPSIFFWPPLWFLGVYETLAGRHEPVFRALAARAVVACAAAALASGALYLLAFVRNVDRLRGHAPSRTSLGSQLLSAAVRRLGRLVARDSLARATFFFTAQTLTRSARHRLYMACFLGLGLAMAVVTVGAPIGRLGSEALDSGVTSIALAVQLNLVFFLLAGARAAAGIPAELKASWIFRLKAGATLQQYLDGTRNALFVLLVLPVLLLLAPLHAALWGWYAAVAHFACGFMLALGLIEALFLRFEKFPFASAYAPGRSLLSLRWPLYMGGYVFYVYVLAEIELVVIRHPELTLSWVALLALAIGGLVAWRARRIRNDRAPIFDGTTEDVQLLGLTQ